MARPSRRLPRCHAQAAQLCMRACMGCSYARQELPAWNRRQPKIHVNGCVQAGASRERMHGLKKDIERVRLQRMLPGLSQGDAALAGLQPVADPREAALQEQLQQVSCLVVLARLALGNCTDKGAAQALADIQLCLLSAAGSNISHGSGWK